MLRALPEFASSAWYRDTSDHRCPHDGWLETLEVIESAEGARGEKRRATILIRLLGAFHDGRIVLRYSGVRSYSLAGRANERGMGDWLDDRFELNDAGTIVHRVTWSGFGPGQESEWTIEAEDVTYEWNENRG